MEKTTPPVFIYLFHHRCFFVCLVTSIPLVAPSAVAERVLGICSGIASDLVLRVSQGRSAKSIRPRMISPEDARPPPPVVYDIVPPSAHVYSSWRRGEHARIYDIAEKRARRESGCRVQAQTECPFVTFSSSGAWWMVVVVVVVVATDRSYQSAHRMQ